MFPYLCTKDFVANMQEYEIDQEGVDQTFLRAQASPAVGLLDDFGFTFAMEDIYKDGCDYDGMRRRLYRAVFLQDVDAFLPNVDPNNYIDFKMITLSVCENMTDKMLTAVLEACWIDTVKISRTGPKHYSVYLFDPDYDMTPMMFEFTPEDARTTNLH